MPYRVSRDWLLDWPFLLSLALLLINDLVLKAAFPGILTGKVSDVVGLFALPVFACALMPRWPGLIHLGAASGFAFWKSPYSQPLIDGWNNSFAWTVGRTVDYTDLLVLPVVVLSYRYVTGPAAEQRRNRSAWRPVVVLVTTFAFAATSYRTAFNYDSQYSLPIHANQIFERLPALGIRWWDQVGDTVTLSIPSGMCFGEIEAKVRLADTPDTSDISDISELEVLELAHRCPEGRADRVELLRRLEHCLLVRLDSAFAADASTMGFAYARIPPSRLEPPRSGCRSSRSP